MEKYASMWKAPTPVERQADARDAWDAITGVSHSKKDTTARLQELFPEARSHNKEAQEYVHLSPMEMLAERNRVLGRNDGEGVPGFIGKKDVIKDRLYGATTGALAGGALGYGGALAAKRLGASILTPSHFGMAGAGLGYMKGIVDADDERLRAAGIDQSAASKYLGFGSGRMVKEASKSSVIRDRLLGAGIATGAVGGGMYQYNRSKKDSKGLSSRAKARAMDEAAYQKSLEMGGSPKSKNAKKIDQLKKKVGDYLDQNPGQAAAMGAVLGGTAAGVGGYNALKRLSKQAV